MYSWPTAEVGFVRFDIFFTWTSLLVFVFLFVYFEVDWVKCMDYEVDSVEVYLKRTWREVVEKDRQFQQLPVVSKSQLQFDINRNLKQPGI